MSRKQYKGNRSPRQNNTPQPATSRAQKDTQKSPKSRQLPAWLDKVEALLPWIVLVVVAILLITKASNYLFRAQELNLFLSTPLFFKQQMVVAGGFLTWLGTYLTQFFYHPWMGVLLLCALWAAIMFVAKKAFRLHGPWNLLLIIPVALLLASDMELGYWLYYLKLRGHFFVATLGTLIALLLVWAYRLLARRPLLATLFIPLQAILFYPLIGFYALLATLLMGVLAWRMPHSTRSKTLASLLALASLVVVPLLYYRLCYYQTSIENIYWTALPLFRLDKSYYTYYIPYYLLVAVLVAFALLGGRRSEKKSLAARLTAWVLFALTLVGTWHFGWYRDENFSKEIDMFLAVEQEDWQRVLDIARDENDEPTRMMWMFKNLALFRLGTQNTDMYRFKNGAKQCNAPFPVHMVQTGAKMLYLHYGQLNFCYRWCLEDGVEYGWRAEHLKFMTVATLLNGEYRVAQKFIDILKQTKYYAEWAEQMETYVGKPALIAKNKSFSPMLRLRDAEDHLTSDNTLVEIYLLNKFAYEGRSDDPLHQEQILLSALQMKNIQLFWPAFFQYARLNPNKHMPRLYQEAAYLYGHLENSVDISQMPFDDDVKKTYEELMAAAQQYSSMGEEGMKPLMQQRFGGTFFYDYFFTRNQKSY